MIDRELRDRMRSGNIQATREYIQSEIQKLQDRLTLELSPDIFRQLQGKAQAYKSLYKIFE